MNDTDNLPALSSESLADWKPGKVRIESVPVRGRTVYIKEMTAGDRDAYEAANLDLGETRGARLKNFRSRLLVNTICDPVSAKLIITDQEFFKDWPVGEIEEAVELAMSLNGMDLEDGGVEEEEGKSERGGIDDSATSSPAN